MLRTRLIRVGPFALLLIASLVFGSTSSGSTRATSGSVNFVDKPFICSDYPQPLDLDLVKVTMTRNSTATTQDAIHLTDGCSGRIARIEVDTWVRDGVKVGSGASDLLIGGGYIHCWDKIDPVHQDGIQAMGGKRVTFSGLEIRCYTSNNAALFINKGLGADQAPEDIVCEGCVLQARGDRPLKINDSLRSGARNSLVCGNVYVGPQAQRPVDVGNRSGGPGDCGGNPPPLPPPTQTPTPTPTPNATPEPKGGKPTTKAGSIRFGHVTIHAPPRSGRLFVLKAPVLDQSGERVTSGLVRCNAKIGHFPIPVIHNPFSNGAAVCTWRVPRRRKGKWVGGIITVVHNGMKAQFTFQRRSGPEPDLTATA
jgi:hypothetical protein